MMKLLSYGGVCCLWLMDGFEFWTMRDLKGQSPPSWAV